jgi:hypothetical protein
VTPNSIATASRVAASEHTSLQSGDRALATKAHEVGREHHRAPRQPVREDPADQQERNERRGLRRDHVAEVGDGAGQVEDGERQRDRDHLVAEHRDDLPREQEPELALAQRAEALPETHRERA